MSMNKISNIGIPNFQQKELTVKTSDKEAQQSKRYVGKAVGSAVGAGSGALGAWYVTSVIKENTDNIKLGFNTFFKVMNSARPEIKGLAEYYEKNSPIVDKTIKNICRGISVASIALATLTGLGIGAIVDSIKNKSTQKQQLEILPENTIEVENKTEKVNVEAK